MTTLQAEGAEELLKLKEEILERWGRLPPEHQATMLLVLVEKSEWGSWAVTAHKLLEASKGGSHESRRTDDLPGAR